MKFTGGSLAIFCPEIVIILTAMYGYFSLLIIKNNFLFVQRANYQEVLFVAS